jgi:DNA repair protein RecN (Recombination protein N)
MLQSLRIRDLALIEAVDMRFEPGLNVLTGETGAGKSILLDSLAFALGWRGRAGLVRPGAERGEVEAVFALAPGHPAEAVLEAAGIAPEGEAILRRTVGADGRAGAFVNDRRVAAETLRALADTLVEIHGQHDDRGLLDPKGHRALLDAYADAAEAAAAVRSAWAAVRAAERALAAARQAHDAAARDAEFLRHAAEELAALDPQPDEEPALDARRRALQAAARVGEDLAAAAAAIGPDGAEGALLDALRRLEGAAQKGGEALDAPLRAPIDAVTRALAELAEAEAGLGDCRDLLEADPFELERVEERLFALRGLARKHQVAPEALPALAAELAARLAALDAGEGAIAERERELAAARAAYGEAAAALAARRRAAAARLDARMAEELPPLKLDAARFLTEVLPGDPGPEGADAVTFTVATGRGLPPGPISRVASGGELSRLMLALKVCLTGRGDGLAIVFDEIDRGVGGATADAVGRRLATLAETAQVLVVTHSPQVAARGAHHWLVGKSVVRGRVRTDILRLDAPAREQEIARMLAGDVVTDEARAAARALMTG